MCECVEGLGSVNEQHERDGAGVYLIWFGAEGPGFAGRSEGLRRVDEDHGTMLRFYTHVYAFLYEAATGRYFNASH